MNRAELLTRAEVAALTGLHPSSVPDWAARRRIRPTPTRQGDAYPGTLTRHIAAQEQRMACAVAAHYRLARFIRNPLNRTA